MTPQRVCDVCAEPRVTSVSRVSTKGGTVFIEGINFGEDSADVCGHQQTTNNKPRCARLCPYPLT